jgi:NADH-quinone oxidoreductase subunit A
MDFFQYQLLLALPDYSTVGVLLLTVLVLGAVILVATHWIGPSRRGAVKDSTYESGMEPVGDTRRRFNVHFYLIAVLFLVFDVEVIFLYPWAVLFPRLRDPQTAADQAWAQSLTSAGYTPEYLLAGVGFFFVLLLVGFIYEWRKGIFKWN